MFCKCGCGLETIAKCGFYKGHWNKGRKRPDLIEYNKKHPPGKDPITNKKAWETRRKNGYKVWNKDLTIEIDERVKNYVNKRNKNIEEISQKISKTKKDKYASGEIISFWYSEDKEKIEKAKEKLRITTIKLILKQSSFIRFNENSILFFEKINREFNLEGVFGKDEFKCLGYSLDFYSKKNNLIIEWDESSHYIKDELKNCDKERQEKIINYLNCNFIRIKQKNISNINYYNQIINLIQSFL